MCSFLHQVSTELTCPGPRLGSWVQRRKSSHGPLSMESCVPCFLEGILSRGEHMPWYFQRNKGMKQFCSYTFTNTKCNICYYFQGSPAYFLTIVACAVRMEPALWPQLAFYLTEAILRFSHHLWVYSSVELVNLYDLLLLCLL